MLRGRASRMSSSIDASSAGVIQDHFRHRQPKHTPRIKSGVCCTCDMYLFSMRRLMRTVHTRVLRGMDGSDMLHVFHSHIQRTCEMVSGPPNWTTRTTQAQSDEHELLEPEEVWEVVLRSQMPSLMHHHFLLLSSNPISFCK